MKLIDVCRLQFQTGEPQGFILSQTPLTTGTPALAGLEDFRLNENAVLDEDQLDGAKFYWLDVLDDTAEISINRGMSIGTGGQNYPIAGTLFCTIQSPTIDPFNSIQFRPNLKVRFQVFWEGDWRTIYRGRLRDINSSYDVDGNVLVTFEATDVIDDLNQGILDEFSVPAQKTGERIYSIIGEVGLNRDLIPQTSAHTYEMAAEDISQNALEACLDAVTHEMGSLFVTRQNKLQYMNYGQTRTSEVEDPIFTNKAIDADNKITMTGIEMSSGKELFYNKVIGVTENDPNIYVKQATVSIQRYGLNVYENRALKFDVAVDIDENGNPIPEAGIGQTLVFEWLDKFLSRWADTPAEITYKGHRRFPKAVTTINRVNDLRYPMVAEVGDKVTIQFETNYVNVEQDSMILSISHNINPDRWLSRFELLPVPNN